VVTTRLRVRWKRQWKRRVSSSNDSCISQLHCQTTTTHQIQFPDAAESQFPSETRAIVSRIVELINSGEINRKISGGDLLSLFRTIGINVKINTTIKIEEHGKYMSFAEKLKQNKEMDDE